MANRYWDSELEDEDIQAAIDALYGVISNSNNGKVLMIEDGHITAKNVGEISGDLPLANGVSF